MKNCRYFNTCEAAICPLDKEVGFEKRIWFPDQDVCKQQEVPDWVKIQKKIRKKKLDMSVGFFTIKSLLKIRDFNNIQGEFNDYQRYLNKQVSDSKKEPKNCKFLLRETEKKCPTINYNFNHSTNIHNAII
jgi:hypothetical protein